jgi:CDP-diacylglycerol---glycerol-3-phosphate 3-phosphatidyltransferase
MAVLEPRAIPNVITVARIVMAPAVALLLFVPGFTPRLAAWFLFLAAALSDLWDGHLARKHGWISEFGQLVDPIADKLLLVATFIPFYMLSRQPGEIAWLPLFGVFPLWILLVIFGRELLITVIRSWAAKAGTVIPAGKAGKLKAVFQNIFVGAMILWIALRTAAADYGWAGDLWQYWLYFHGTVVMCTLAVALWLTVYSLVVYLIEWRKLVRPAG